MASILIVCCSGPPSATKEPSLMSYLEINCPGCKREKTVPPGRDYTVCDKCATPHCDGHSGRCKVPECNGWLKKRVNPK